MKRNRLDWNLYSLKEGENEFHLSLKPEELGIAAHTVDKTIECALTLKRNGTKVLLQGQTSFLLVLECARCFGRFILARKVNLAAYFIPKKTFDNGEKENLSITEVLTEYYKNDIINLAPILYDSVNLSIPIKPLCRDDCKGLCPICGTNLDVKKCNCKREKINPRWTPLEKLLEKK